jgi:hypothetical protein
MKKKKNFLRSKKTRGQLRGEEGHTSEAEQRPGRTPGKAERERKHHR